MNTTKLFYQQQYGNAKWTTYDHIVERFRCLNEDHYTQILPNDDTASETPIFACKFAPHSPHLLALANEDGKLAIHDTTNKEERHGLRAHNNAIFDIAWQHNSTKIATAAGDHTASLFDVAGGAITKIKTFWGHSRSVKTIAFRKDDPSVFATGGRDGNIIVWDTRTELSSLVGKPDRTIFNSHNTKTPSGRGRRKCACSSPTGVASAKSVTGLGFQDANTLISCGAGDGVLKVWDLRKNYLFSKHEPAAKARIPYAGASTKNGFSHLLIDHSALKLYANCLDHTIYSYNLGTYNPEPVMRYTGHFNSTFFIKSSLSGDGHYLISGSSDENAYIWSVDAPRPLVKLKGHNAEVTCVAWSDNVVATCSDDMSHKIWRIGGEDRPENWEISVKGSAEPLSGVSLAEMGDSKRAECKCTPKSVKRKRGEESGGEGPSAKREFEPKCLFKREVKLETVAECEPEVGLSVNLPNFVVDGIAPHLNYSPPKRKGKDWLTKMRIERKLFKRENAADEEKVRLGADTTTPNKAVQTPILNFFKVKCDGHAGNSKSFNNCLVSSPQRSQSIKN